MKWHIHNLEEACIPDFSETVTIKYTGRICLIVRGKEGSLHAGKEKK